MLHRNKTQRLRDSQVSGSVTEMRKCVKNDGITAEGRHERRYVHDAGYENQSQRNGNE